MYFVILFIELECLLFGKEEFCCVGINLWVFFLIMLMLLSLYLVYFVVVIVD